MSLRNVETISIGHNGVENVLKMIRNRLHSDEREQRLVCGTNFDFQNKMPSGVPECDFSIPQTRSH